MTFFSQNYNIERHNMVEQQLISRGISSPVVLEAMCNVPRHLFVPESIQNNAYFDSPMPIGLGQTISQPYIVAYMTEQLDPYPGMKVLEIGTGSGYQAAILSYIGCEVYTIEFLKEHADKARQTLHANGFDTVIVKYGNGYIGWPEESPFDAIIVTAAPENIPPALINQLKTGGKMIVPVGEMHAVQSLNLLTKEDEHIKINELMLVRFVPMVESLDSTVVKPR